jgi:hypothetical protein
MKLVCDCGNEMEFITIDPDTGKEYEEDYDYGVYATKDSNKFETWAAHDQAGFTCRKCKKSIWYWA